eukprot:364913-Chlamydomonas_euryale.AAC.9
MSHTARVRAPGSADDHASAAARHCGVDGPATAASRRTASSAGGAFDLTYAWRRLSHIAAGTQLLRSSASSASSFVDMSSLRRALTAALSPLVAASHSFGKHALASDAHTCTDHGDRAHG